MCFQALKKLEEKLKNSDESKELIQQLRFTIDRGNGKIKYLKLSVDDAVS